MSCKFKGKHDGCSRPYCKVTNGECQFIVSPYDDHCSILNAYKDLVLSETGNEETPGEPSDSNSKKFSAFSTKIKNLKTTLRDTFFKSK